MHRWKLWVRFYGGGLGGVGLRVRRCIGGVGMWSALMSYEDLHAWMTRYVFLEYTSDDTVLRAVFSYLETQRVPTHHGLCL